MRYPWLRALLLLFLDASSFLIAFLVAAHLRGLEPSTTYLLGILLPFILAALALYLIDGYSRRTDMLALDYATMHALAVCAAMLGTLFTTFTVITEAFPLQSSRLVVVIGFALAGPLTLASRRLLYLRQTHRPRTLVFVGDPADWRRFREEFQLRAMPNPLLYCGPARQTQETHAPESTPLETVLADMDAGRLQIEAIILKEGAPDLDPNYSEKLIQRYFQGTPSYTLELFHQMYWRKIPLYRLNQTWLFQEGFHLARGVTGQHVKRLLDILFSLLGLLFFTPLLLVCLFLIRLADGAPVFFTQTRIGLNNIPFTILKLRTMRAVPEEHNTSETEPRITSFGRFLRKFRIDELPQLLNVLKGEMSLIGPRAEWDKLASDYESHIPCYRFRHLVRPGITGWAQVCHPHGVGIQDARRKLEYDLYYIRHFSIRLDASIILKTIHTILFAKGR